MIDHCLINKPFAIAAILKTGDLTSDTLVSGVSDPELCALAGKIALREVADLAGWNMRLSITLNRGKRIDGDSKDLDLSQVHLGWQDAAAKFRKSARGVLGAEQAELLVRHIGGLENYPRHRGYRYAHRCAGEHLRVKNARWAAPAKSGVARISRLLSGFWTLRRPAYSA